MDRLPPRHPALFSLKPCNKRARGVVSHQNNRQFVSTLADGTPALDVGRIRLKSANTLETLGRSREADIRVDGSSIAKVQCSFEIDPHTHVVLFYDRSSGQTTQVYGDNMTPFEYKRPRKVVVLPKLNTKIGMGGEGRNLVVFELVWHLDPVQTIENIKSRVNIGQSYEEDPLFARTIYEEDPRPARTIDNVADTVITPESKQLKMRYARIGVKLGCGQFGKVYKAVDVDSGKLMAVKILRPAPHELNTLKREIETLAKIQHAHIVDYIASQCWDKIQVEIFMGLKEGTLKSLVGGRGDRHIAKSVLDQMLQALDYLAIHGIVHRDVKPENILYVTRPDNQYLFQLGDFGVCNHVASAATIAGTLPYMAPEICMGGAQTHKVDIWSLFVTLLWTLGVGAFRQTSIYFTPYHEIHEAVLSAALNQKLISIREMAAYEPEERASAAQMLVKCFKGRGLSTPQNQVPALSTAPRNQVPGISTAGIAQQTP